MIERPPVHTGMIEVEDDVRRGRIRRWLSRCLSSARTSRRSDTQVEVQRVPYRSTYVRVSTIGHTGDRAFVLVPGIGVSSNYFERLATRLNDYGPVHALDLPGFGGVPHPERPRLTIRQYADLVGTVIDQLGLKDPVLVGHSMGTQVVADLAARYPGEFAGPGPLSTVVLLGPVLSPEHRRLRTATAKFLRSALKESPRVALLAVQAYLLCGPRWFSRILPEMLRYPIEDVLPAVSANTLVVSGSEDALCPPEWLDQVAELLPSCRVTVIPGAAHSIMHAHADVVAQLSVLHARRPGKDPLPVPEAGPESEDYPVRLAQVAGQVTELAGIATDDDSLIARGKTTQARAITEASPDQPT